MRGPTGASGGGRVLAAYGRVAATFAPETARAHFSHGGAEAGAGWMRSGGTVEPGSRDMRRPNFLALAEGLRMVQAFLRPDSVPAGQRWRIEGALRDQLLRALALTPRGSDDPRYDEASHPDGLARWFLVGDVASRDPTEVTMFGKTGMAYGMLSKVACIVDRARDVELLLAAAIHANADGALDDDRDEYDTVARPFLAALGRAASDEARAREAGR